MTSKIDPAVPQAVLNAAMVAAMREHPQPVGRCADWPWADMTPVVVGAVAYDKPNKWGDSWWVDVRYSSQGFRATYGVNRSHVARCYAD